MVDFHEFHGYIGDNSLETWEDDDPSVELNNAKHMVSGKNILRVSSLNIVSPSLFPMPNLFSATGEILFFVPPVKSSFLWVESRVVARSSCHA